MDKKIIMLLGAAAALTTLNDAHAAVGPATNYRVLLDPIPDAVAALKADDARLSPSASKLAFSVEVGLGRRRHHHHHHHHGHR